MYTAFASLLLITPLLSHALADDQNQMIEVFSDQANYSEKTGKAIYTGNVIITQGSIKLEAERVEVEQQSSSLLATGQPAHFEQQPDPDKPIIKASAQSILYKQLEGHVELTGDAHVHQGETNIKSEHIIYNVNEQTLAASNNSNQNDKPSRVHVIIPPANKTTDNKP